MSDKKKKAKAAKATITAPAAAPLLARRAVTIITFKHGPLTHGPENYVTARRFSGAEKISEESVIHDSDGRVYVELPPGQWEQVVEGSPVVLHHTSPVVNPVTIGFGFLTDEVGNSLITFTRVG